MSDKLTKVESGAIAPPRADMDIEGVIRYAIEKGMNAETMQGFMVIRRELRAERAKSEFDAAMAAFQAECPVVMKTVPVPDRSGATAYKFAPFEHCIEVSKPFREKHGFSYSLDTDTETAPGWVTAICEVTHTGGHHLVKKLKLPLGTKTGIMSDTQVYAATLTFACRRVFCNAFGIVVAGEDRDGSTGKKPKPPGPSSLHGENAPTATDNENKKKLTDLTRSIHFAKGYAMDDDARNKLTQFLVDEGLISDTQTVSDLTGAALAGVVAKVQAKLQLR